MLPPGFSIHLMATPRSLLIDPNTPLHYHLISRCVRRSFLCGKDKLTGKNYDYRKRWILNRLMQLTPAFAIAVEAYAIMSNHFHLVVYYDPQECHRWSNEEVADRWLTAFPPRSHGENDEQALLSLHRSMILSDPEKLNHARETLGSVSMFMKYLKQPIAYRANKEDDCTGHFFESRFHSGAILGEDGIIAAMAYVDLNPVRAKIVKSFQHYDDASGQIRLRRNSTRTVKQAIKPLYSGLSTARPELSFTVQDYLNILSACESDYRNPDTDDSQSRWSSAIASFSEPQRAYGNAEELQLFAKERGWSVVGTPMTFR